MFSKKMAYFLLFCVGALFISQTEAKPRSPPPPPPAPSPDHFWLVHTWPKGFCSKFDADCKLFPLPDMLTTHGWWPVDESGYTMTLCQNTSDIGYAFHDSDLYKKMINEWPNLQAPSDNRGAQIGFWSYEFKVHGTCSTFIPKAYFQKALNLKEKIDIFQALRAERIVAGAVYQRSAFEKAIRNKIGTPAFAISCINKNGTQILHEITICTDVAKAIPCSQRNDMSRDNCGKGGIKLVSVVET